MKFSQNMERSGISLFYSDEHEEITEPEWKLQMLACVVEWTEYRYLGEQKGYLLNSKTMLTYAKTMM